MSKTKTAAPFRLPSQAQILERTGGRPGQWAGRCHELSTIVAELIGPELATVRRGYYIGPVEPTSYFAGRLGQHSWVELRDGQVCDPTRFSFAGGEPWPLWVGPADDYDIGGCKRSAPAGPPPDSYDTTNFRDEECDYIELRLGSFEYVADLLDTPEELRHEDDETIEVTLKQASWLGNLPVKDYEGYGVLSRDFAAEVYEALCEAGRGVVIPIDRLDWILPERSEGRSSF